MGIQETADLALPVHRAAGEVWSSVEEIAERVGIPVLLAQQVLDALDAAEVMEERDGYWRAI